MNDEQMKEFNEWYEAAKHAVTPPTRLTHPFHGKAYYMALAAWNTRRVELDAAQARILELEERHKECRMMLGKIIGGIRSQKISFIDIEELTLKALRQLKEPELLSTLPKEGRL